MICKERLIDFVVFVLLLASGIVGCTPAVAYRPSDASVQRIVKGEGRTRNEALEDAILTAIKREVGVYMSSEMVLENGELLKDRLHSLSNGYVNEARILSSQTTDQDFVKVKALVRIRRGDLRERIRLLASDGLRIDQAKLVAIKAHKRSGRQFEPLLEKVVFEPMYKNPGTWEIKLEKLDLHPDGQHLIVEYSVGLTRAYLSKVASFLDAFAESGNHGIPSVLYGDTTIRLSEKRHRILRKAYKEYFPLGRKAWLTMQYSDGRKYADGGGVKELPLMYARLNLPWNRNHPGIYMPGDYMSELNGGADYISRFAGVYPDTFRPWCPGACVKAKYDVFKFRMDKQKIRQHIRVDDADLSELSRVEIGFSAFKPG